MENIFEHNLKRLRECRPQLWQVVQDLSPGEIKLEPARDGAFTCKIKRDGTERYIYSKYAPRKVKVELPELATGVKLVVLGLGLGCELEEILASVSQEQEIYVVEANPEFFYHLLATRDLHSLLQDRRVHFLFGREAYTALPLFGEIAFCENNRLTVLYPAYYAAIRNNCRHNSCHPNTRDTDLRVAIYEHPTFAGDLVEAFSDLGFKVKSMKWWQEDEGIFRDLSRFRPTFVLSINLSPRLVEICEQLQLPYAAWTVDTPAFTLYQEKSRKPHVLNFIYDSNVVEKLSRIGFGNVFYLPAATNTRRLGAPLEDGDEQRYSCDVSFVGSTALNNEYRNLYAGRLESWLEKLLEEMMEEQVRCPEEFILPALINRYDQSLNLDITGQILQQTGVELTHLDYLSDFERVVYHLAKEISGRYRRQVISRLGAKFGVDVYGDEGWKQVDPTGSQVRFRGQARHYLDLHRIYRLSRINLNFTRTYVGDKALPVRVFDVLGAGGFLVTNYKQDLDRLFVPGKDMVVFRDEQELFEVIGYYLQHEEERRTIIMSGLSRVRENHTFQHRAKEIWDLVRKNVLEVTGIN